MRFQAARARSKSKKVPAEPVQVVSRTLCLQEEEGCLDHSRVITILNSIKGKTIGTQSALTYKARNNEILVLEDFNLEAPKTKDYTAMLTNLNIDGKKSLVILNEPNKNLYLSSRNLPKARVVTISELTTYDILNSASLVFLRVHSTIFRRVCNRL